MRLSAELLGQAEQRPNPLGERELILRGLAIPMIEHLGATRDAYDAIDFCDNRITTIGNFPRLKRLSNLMFMNNAIEHIDAINMSKNVPNLSCLILTNNSISGLHEVANMGKACPKLEFLSLLGNPIIRRQHYRLYTILKIPTLKVLDFIKVKEAEREKAQRLGKSAAGAALEGDIRIEAREAMANASKTFEPGEGRTAEEAFATSFTPEQKTLIRDMVANASSPAEIERIEGLVKRGIFPEAPPPPPAVTPPNNTADNADGNMEESSDSDDDGEDDKDGKRSRDSKENSDSKKARAS